jgi:hypothetical protein
MELRNLVMNILGSKIINTQEIEDYLNFLLAFSGENPIKNLGITQSEFSAIMEESLNEAFADYEIDLNTLEIKGKNALKGRASKRV